MNTIQGFIDGKSYYTMEGKDYVKSSSAPSKERLANDPAYAKVRGNYQLFASASVLSTSLRKPLEIIYSDAMYNRISSSITALFRTILLNAAGGAIFRLKDHTALLQRFSFYKNRIFETNAYMPYTICMAADRKKITLKLKPFQRRRLKKDGTLSHFRMSLAVLCYSDFQQEDAGEYIRYVPVVNDLHTCLMHVYSDYTDAYILTRERGYVLKLPDTMPDTLSLVTVVHVSFYEEVNGTMYLLQGDSVMKVAEVF